MLVRNCVVSVLEVKLMVVGEEGGGRVVKRLSLATELAIIQSRRHCRENHRRIAGTR